MPWRPDFNALAYVLSGQGTAGAEAAPVRTGQLAVFGSGDTITLTAAEQRPARRVPARRPADP